MPGTTPMAKATWVNDKAVEDAGGTGHGGADDEGQDDGAVGVDAHQGGRALVLGDGPDGGAGA